MMMKKNKKGKNICNITRREKKKPTHFILQYAIINRDEKFPSNDARPRRIQLFYITSTKNGCSSI